MNPHQGLAHVLAHVAFKQRARPGAYGAGREVLAHRYRVFQRWRVPRSTVSRFWVKWVLEGTFKHEGHSSTQDEVDMCMKSITQLTSHNHHYGQAIYKPNPRPDQNATVELALQQPPPRRATSDMRCIAPPLLPPPRPDAFSAHPCAFQHTQAALQERTKNKQTCTYRGMCTGTALCLGRHVTTHSSPSLAAAVAPVPCLPPSALPPGHPRIVWP